MASRFFSARRWRSAAVGILPTRLETARRRLPRPLSITLFGAAGEVTGSCTLIEVGSSRIVVDCGMIQGSAKDEQRNRDLPDLGWDRVDAIVLTHAHIDHCGRLPMVGPAGFVGTVWVTEPTQSILSKVLRGSASLQQVRRQEWIHGTAPTARAIFDGDPLHLPKEEAPEPPILFVNSHVSAILARVRSVAWETPVRIAPDVTATFLNAGHVFGAASVELRCGSGAEECVILASGDLGPRVNELLMPPAPPARADVILLESTNGARETTAKPDPEGQFARICAEAGPRHERILVPTFAIGRAQQIVLRLARLARRDALAGLNVYLDATMAVRVNDRFRLHPEYLAPAVREAFERGESPLEFPGLHRLTSRTQSLALRDLRRGGVILAGAGFCDAGPILHHLTASIDREDCRVILAGFHPKGSIGDGLRRGAKLVEINGAIIEVKAKVEEIEGLSGHGTREDLLAWLAEGSARPQRVILNHGTEDAREALAGAIESTLGYAVSRPVSGETIAP